MPDRNDDRNRFREDWQGRYGGDEREGRPGLSLLDSRWMWVFFGLAGLVAFEIGVHPAITAVLFCVKLGFSHLSNGLWLWRKDPRPLHGAVLGLGYVALAGWRVVLWSFLLSAFLSYVSTIAMAFQGQPGRLQPAADLQIVGALGAMFGVMLVATSVLSALLCVVAGTFRIPLWLSKRVTEWRVADCYPPNPIGGNSATSLLNYSLLVICLTMLVLVVALAWGLGEAGLPGFIVALIGVPVFTLVMRDWLDRRIIARSPSECWDQLSETAVADAGYEDDAVDGDSDGEAPYEDDEDEDDGLQQDVEVIDDEPPAPDWRLRTFGA